MNFIELMDGFDHSVDHEKAVKGYEEYSRKHPYETKSNNWLKVHGYPMRRGNKRMTFLHYCFLVELNLSLTDDTVYRLARFPYRLEKSESKTDESVVDLDTSNNRFIFVPEPADKKIIKHGLDRLKHLCYDVVKTDEGWK